jgi:hypothetical protein
MHRITAILLSAAAALSLSLLPACSTAPTLATNADPQVNFAAYHTFQLAPTRAPDRPEFTPELIRQVNEATSAAFTQRGLTAAADNPDVIILVHGAIEERVDITDWGFNYGRFHRWGWGDNNRYELNQYREGTLLIDVFDAKTKNLVWRGSAVGQVPGPPDINRIRSAINDIVNRFPH